MPRSGRETDDRDVALSRPGQVFTGSAVERTALLNQLYGMIRRRLEAFTSLPFGTLERMALKARLDELGDSSKFAV